MSEALGLLQSDLADIRDLGGIVVIVGKTGQLFIRIYVPESVLDFQQRNILLDGEQVRVMKGKKK